MADGLSLNLKVSKDDFQARVDAANTGMGKLMDVIERYEQAKDNLDQFMEEGDSNYYEMVDRIDINIKAAKKTYAALQETKATLEKTIQQMEGMSGNVKDVLEDAKEAAISTINAGFKIESIL
jgi:methyl-accepting chemotaxis protein